MTSWMAAAAMVSSLAACDSKPAGADASATAVGGGPAASATDTPPGVKPVPEDHAASAHGPSDGAAAIGGVAGGQGTGAHPSPPQGNTPAPTAGDGAASAASQ